MMIWIAGQLIRLCLYSYIMSNYLKVSKFNKKYAVISYKITFVHSAFSFQHIPRYSKSISYVPNEK